MKVSELIARLNGRDPEAEVRFAIWDSEKGDITETYPINDVNPYDYLDPVLYIWSE